MNVRLFGAVHVDRLRKVRAELDDLSEGTDAFCLERPAESEGYRTWLRLFARTPLTAAGLGIFALVQLPLIALVTRDLRPPEQVAAASISTERDRPVHGVDALFPVLSEWGGGPWIAVNWLGALAVLVAGPVAALATTVVLTLPRAAYLPAYQRNARLGTVVALAGTVGGALALLAASSFSFPVFVFGGLLVSVATWCSRTDRDAIMATNTRALADEHGYDDVTLVAGRAHVNGLRRAFAGRATVAAVHLSRPFVSGSTNWTPGTIDTLGSPDPARRDVLGRRVGAALVDLVLAVAVAAPLGLVSFVFLFEAATPDTLDAWLVLIGATVGMFAYYAGLEALFGRTVGKRVAGLVVCRTDGSPITGREAIVRNVVRPLDALGGYLVGFVMILASDAQRLGDVAARTAVVRQSD